ncbi:sugar phosphate isomerase/epimerase family protein [Terribacillus saccharophilus]|uniref:sugar phosphate isomerase/epimerase family protein n=1 Tax=Terribacillus saccharophilus TaxID=361277 RepID=UPI003828A0EF
MNTAKKHKEKFSLAHLTALQVPPPEFIRMASRTGYDYASIRTIYMGLPGEPNYDLSTNKEMLEDTKKALKETGLKVWDIELVRVEEETDPVSLVPSFKIAQELGANHVIASIWTDDLEFGKNSFAQICDLAKPYGLTVQLEFVTIAGVYNLKGALAILNSVKRQNAAILVDSHHFHRSVHLFGDKVEDLKRIPRKWINFFHLCNATSTIPVDVEEMTRILREERLYVDEEGIDNKEILSYMPDDIVYSLEIPHKQRVEAYGNEEHARKCLESAKNFFTSSKVKKEVVLS